MLRSETKQALVLLVFSFLLKEVLTLSTQIGVLAGVVAVVNQYRPRRLIRNGLALIIFGSYWFSYGKVIDPEVGLNFLTMVVVLKLLEKDGRRDHYMIFMGLILLISSGSLFEKTLTYMFYFVLGFLVLLWDFYQEIGRSPRISEMLKALLWAAPISLMLFFVVPRMMYPIPLQYGGPVKGEMGYTPEVNISSVESLSASNKEAFTAVVSRELTQADLYWRGNVLSQSDGWNWLNNLNDRPAKRSVSEGPKNGLIRQEIKTQGKSDFFFALDRPERILIREETLELASNRTLPQRRFGAVDTYIVESSLGRDMKTDERPEAYLAATLPMKDRLWIDETFKGKSASEINSSVREFFSREGFIYTLSPGKVESFRDFIKKKAGFCSHYASALALILRSKNIPARLVSGFMGGSFNSYGKFYVLTQNDAHVWVEFLQGDTWTRVDPTEWVAPDRVRLGGEAFVNSISDSAFFMVGRNWKFYRELEAYFRQLDFRFYQWLEEMDYYYQESWLKTFGLRRGWLYSLTPLLLLFFLFLYLGQARYWGFRKNRNHHERLWDMFLKKAQKNGLKLPLNSVDQGREYLRKSGIKDQEKWLLAWESLIQYSYQETILPEEVEAKIKTL